MGEIIPVEVFVAILPHSQYTYVQACQSQKRNEFIACCVNALTYYGGVPKAIVSDNLKSAVKRASKYEADINRTFKDFARHYNCVINPTRGYAPQDNALVGNAVHLTYQRIYYPLREMTFFSIAELNKEIRQLLVRYNTLLFQRKEVSRIEPIPVCRAPIPETKHLCFIKLLNRIQLIFPSIPIYGVHPIINNLHHKLNNYEQPDDSKTKVHAAWRNGTFTSPTCARE